LGITPPTENNPHKKFLEQYQQSFISRDTNGSYIADFRGNQNTHLSNLTTRYAKGEQDRWHVASNKHRNYSRHIVI
jgi:hypothetical protein